MANEPRLNTRIDNDQATILFDHIGGWETCQRLSERFHDRVANDPALRAIFPNNLTRLTEWFALFLAEKLGATPDYTARRGKQSLGCRHAHLSIGADDAERWLSHMFAAMEEVGVSELAQQRLQEYFTEIAHTLGDPFLPYYLLPLDELRAKLNQDSHLATTSDRGRSLLRDAAHRWDLPRVALLLSYGAGINVLDRLGHDPLYHALTPLASSLEAEGVAVVGLLIQHGANVNGQSGPEKTTPLHMAARRGHVGIAEVLLEAGAEIEGKDSKGETPLRRAVNCGQVGMVRLLLSHGADPLSRDKQGRTPLDAVRHEPIRRALQEAKKEADECPPLQPA